LPFGTNRRFLNAAPALIQQVLGQWQFGSIMRWTTGAPLTITAGGINTIWQETGGNTPNILGVLPKASVLQVAGKNPTVFPTLTQGKDPNCAGVTATNTLNVACSLLAMFDAQGNAILVNPGPGTVGSLGKNTIEGPSRFQLDMNLQKKFRLDERREFEFRSDVTNVLNHTVFAVPTTNINSASFGQIDSAGVGQQFTLGMRLNF